MRTTDVPIFAHARRKAATPGIVPGLFCQVAAVPLVAVSTWPSVGAVALDVFTVVVALATALAMPAVRLAAVPLILVPVSVGVVVSVIVPPEA